MRRRSQAKKDRLRATIDGWKADFRSFANELDVIDKDGNRIRVQASPILLAFDIARTGRDYVLKPRQVYMTTWELARDLYFMITRPGAKVTILCQSDKDNTAVKAISHRIQVMLGTDEAAKSEPEAKHGLLGRFPELRIVEHSQTRWSFGASELAIVGAGATEKSANKKGRSGTIHRLHVTEVAFFEYADQTLTAILECVPPHSPNNEIVFESTPLGASGYFYEKYNLSKTGTNGYKAHFFQWFKQAEYRAALAPGEVIEPQTEREKELVKLHGITPEQIKWYRQRVADKGQAKVDQEYPSDEETCWLFDGRMFFDREALSRLRGNCKPPIETKFAGAYKIWIKPDPKKTYILSADPSNGVGGDPMSAVVIEQDTGIHCASLHGQFTADVFGTRLAQVGYEYGYALLVVERSASYQAVLNSLADWKRPGKGEAKGYPNVYSDQDRKYGFKISGTSRPAVLDALEEAVRKTLVTFDYDLVSEAFLFIVQEEKPQAAPGAHDDRVMAMAIAQSLVTEATGVKPSDFADAPSIAFEEVSISFENAPILEQSRGIGVIDEYMVASDYDGF